MLVPLDGSSGAERAIPVAARIARASGGSIVFMRVILPPAELGVYGAEPILAIQSSAFKRRIATAANYLAETMSAYTGDLAGVATETDVAVATADRPAARYDGQEQVDRGYVNGDCDAGMKHRVIS